MKKSNKFHDELKLLMDQYVNMIYNYTLNFPKDEIFGIPSQVRRYSLSVILNYIEGYARGKDKKRD